MSFRIAVASSDGINIDTHFGHADKFYIYDVDENGAYNLVKINSPPKEKVKVSTELTRVVKNGGSCDSGGCGGNGGCGGGVTVDFNVGYFEGSKYVLASKIGNGITKALIKKNITPFSIELPVDKAVEKIVIYEKRLNRFNKQEAK